ncbi:MAG: Rv2578c family radical SAM protein, partial [Mycobacterium sp.]
GIAVDDGALPGLQRLGFVRSVHTPQFEGITFHEVLCKSALNRVPDAAALPFRYTVNPYRGCSHACRYCFARPTHEYLELDVMVAPVLPHLTDSVEQLDGLLSQIAGAGATGVTVLGLHLRGSTRGWFLAWLARSHPELVGCYRELYRRGAYLPQLYRDALGQRVRPLIAKHGLTGDQRRGDSALPHRVVETRQPTLF